mgnify:CR=1 FL=1
MGNGPIHAATGVEWLGDTRSDDGVYGPPQHLYGGKCPIPVVRRTPDGWQWSLMHGWHTDPWKDAEEGLQDAMNKAVDAMEKQTGQRKPKAL